MHQKWKENYSSQNNQWKTESCWVKKDTSNICICSVICRLPLCLADKWMLFCHRADFTKVSLTSLAGLKRKAPGLWSCAKFMSKNLSCDKNLLSQMMFGTGTRSWYIQSFNKDVLSVLWTCYIFHQRLGNVQKTTGTSDPCSMKVCCQVEVWGFSPQWSWESVIVGGAAHIHSKWDSLSAVLC
jgi:hypothetical protein